MNHKKTTIYFKSLHYNHQEQLQKPTFCKLCAASINVSLTYAGCYILTTFCKHITNMKAQQSDTNGVLICVFACMLAWKPI